jgi:methylated-DNA-[protein]-cysteine S-methyltransferase
MTPAPPRRADAAPRVAEARRTIETPIGPLLLIASPDGLRAVLWPGEDGSRIALHGLVGADGGPGGEAPPEAPNDARAEAHLDRAAHELTEYFAGARRTFAVALDPIGTPFQRAVWDVLRTIPYGTTMSYGAQAAALGDPAKARAVGAANGRNPLSIVVPCHRVVAASGHLTGFAGGLDTKAWLLAHEQHVLAVSGSEPPG